MKTLSIVVPVYYNEQSLPPLFDELESIERQFLERSVQLQLIFVDDGSGDQSLSRLLEFKERRPSTTVVKLTRNFGAVHATKTGIRLVTGDCFLVLAADLQDPPELILQMVDHWMAGHKYVVCVRQDRQDPPVAKVYSAIYYHLLRIFVIKDYPSGGYDLALMDKAFLPYLQDSSKNINTPLFAYWLGFKPTTLHYSRRKRQHGRSRWTFSKRLKFFLDSLLGFSIVPIRMISCVGVVVSLLSFLYGSVVAINALRGVSNVQGFPTIVALLAFLLGLIIIMLGVIGEYIWRIFDEVNKRPETVIDDIY